MKSFYGKMLPEHVSREKRDDKKPRGVKHKAYDCYRSTLHRKARQRGLRGGKDTEFGVKNKELNPSSFSAINNHYTSHF